MCASVVECRGRTVCSSDKANKIAVQLKVFSSDFSGEQIQMLISKVGDSKQITGSYQFPILLEEIRETASQKSLDFGDLLREHGLEDHCVVVSGEEEEIPF